MTLVDTYDDLDIKLAAEDHRRGKPFGEQGHCTRCDETYRIANCPHDDVITMKTLAGDIVAHHCADCGVSAKDLLSRTLDRRFERNNPNERPTIPDWAAPARGYEKGR